MSPELDALIIDILYGAVMGGGAGCVLVLISIVRERLRRR